jgi:succinate dehydrogenase / fumarate reductase, flavoprotein subunit
MHGSNRLGGNSLSDLLVFGRRAGLGASDYVRALAQRPAVSDTAIEEATTLALLPFEPKDNAENPYTLHAELQQSMNDLAGIIRKEGELEEALAKIDELKARYANVVVEGGRLFNPGWHLAIDMRNMLLVSECVAKAALQRTESRGGHTRDDFPKMDAQWRNKLLVCKVAEPAADGVAALVPDVDVTPEQQPVMRADLLATFELSELEKYYTDDQLAEHPERKG